jgi:hypothetical protein
LPISVDLSMSMGLHCPEVMGLLIAMIVHCP